MSARYTSPELSRQLAEAGLEQESRDGHWWCNAACADDHVMSRPHRTAGFGPRALDLTDILAELTRPRPEEADARSLASEFDIEWVTGVVRVRAWAPGTAGGKVEHGASIVEAAGLVLLALLRERNDEAAEDQSRDLMPGGFP